MINKTAKILASNYFFAAIVGLFVLEAGWLAVSNGFPMAYDEAYHTALIVFFSHHLNPIITSQPANTYGLGAIIHRPSFLYYYALSFPYRLLIHFTQNLRIIVTLLRFLNIAFAIGSLVFMRKSLRLLGLNKLVSNIVALAFALTPIFTVLSSVINYNNLMIFLGSICIYWTLLMIIALRRGQYNVRLLSWLIALCMLTSMIDFEFLPVFVGVGLCLAFEHFRHWEVVRKTIAKAWRHFTLARLLRLRNLALLIIGVISLGLFISSYGFDVARYHNPEPQCNQILTVRDCKHYYSWDRNYTAAQNDHFSKHITIPSMAHYSYIWVGQMRTQLYGVQSPAGIMTQAYPLLHWVVLCLAIIGLLCCIFYARKILNNHRLLLPLAVIVIVYVTFLWGRNYYDYKMLGQAVAIQARYLLPVLIYLYATLALGLYYALRRTKPYLPAAVIGLVIIVFVFCGGAEEYATRITPNYTWAKYNLTRDQNFPI